MADGFLQNGICYTQLDAAKADFISRIADLNERHSVIRVFKFTPTSEFKAIFPSCVTNETFFFQYFAVLIGMVILCLTFKWIKEMAFI